MGQNAFEEINSGISGANYGWPSEKVRQQSAFTNPIFSYDHTVGQAVIGGYVYRGSGSEGLQGQYFYADVVTGKVFTLRFNGSVSVSTERTSQITPNAGAINNPNSFGEDGAATSISSTLTATFSGLHRNWFHSTRATASPAMAAMTSCSRAPATTCWSAERETTP